MSESQKSKTAVTFGIYIRNMRRSCNLTLRDVETASNGFIANGWLSQLENGQIETPRPETLEKLAEIYNHPFESLMQVKGYLPPRTFVGHGLNSDSINGGPTFFHFPEMTSNEFLELMDYLTFIRKRKERIERDEDAINSQIRKRINRKLRSKT